MEILVGWNERITSDNYWTNLIDGQLRWDTDAPYEQNWHESTDDEATFLD